MIKKKSLKSHIKVVKAFKSPVKPFMKFGDCNYYYYVGKMWYVDPEYFFEIIFVIDMNGLLIRFVETFILLWKYTSDEN